MAVGPTARYVTATAVAAAVAGVWWSCSRQPDLVHDARSISDAILDGDGDRYFAFVSDVEKERFRLTDDKIRKVFEKIVRPAFSGFERMSARQSDSLGSHQAYDYVLIQNAQGQQFELSAAPFAGERGGVTSIALPISHAWMLDFVVKRGSPVTGATAAYARARGVRRDREFLESLGITGRVSEMDPTQFNDWPTYLKWTEELCKTQFADELRALGIRYQPAGP